MNPSELGSMAQNFNWHSPSWDLFIFLFWAVAAVIYAFSAGRGRIISILISVYMAKLLVLEAPFLSTKLAGNLSGGLVALQQLIVFLVLFMLLFVFLGKYAFRTSVEGRKFGSIVFGLIFSVLQIGLLINIILTLLPDHIQNGFSPLIQTMFIRDPLSFVWLVAPLVFLIVLGRHVADVNEL